MYERHLLHAKKHDLSGTKVTKDIEDEVTLALRSASVFSYASEKSLRKVAKKMKRVNFEKGQVLISQGEPVDRLFLIAEGSVLRLRYIDDQLHQVETVGSNQHRGGFGALHFLKCEPTYATALAETDGVAYTLESGELNRLLDRDPSLAKEMLYSLSKEVFRMSRLRTPLLEQDPKPLSFFATSLGATIESYYRSGLNAWLNAKLSGKPPGSLFPSFHIQIPTRIGYINGFKFLRSWLAENVYPNEYNFPEAVRLGTALLPGIAMTPVSSVLEACNADHMNPEPLSRRWMRGYLPRTAREMIFGVGINQLSDACEERVADIENSFLRTVAGSLMAGIAAGYLSHVPHNISTMKLLRPHLSYGKIISQMVDENVSRTPPELPGPTRRAIAGFLSVFFPKGCVIRTAQIAGSFIIINSTIQAFAGHTSGPTTDSPKLPLASPFKVSAENAGGGTAK